jgi:uncharacterized protein YggE
MKNTFFLLMVLVFVPQLLLAQTFPYPEKEKPYIEVNGTSEMEVVPDEIFVRLILSEKYEKSEKLDVAMQEDFLKAILHEMNVPLANLSLSDAKWEYYSSLFVKKHKVSRKEYSLKLHKASQVGDLFVALEEKKMLDATIIRVSHSQIDSLRRENRIKAIKAAKTKADYLLEAIGERSGKALIVNEINQFPYLDIPVTRQESRIANSYENFDGEREFYKRKEQEIEFQKIKISSSIFVKFEIGGMGQ